MEKRNFVSYDTDIKKERFIALTLTKAKNIWHVVWENTLSTACVIRTTK